MNDQVTYPKFMDAGVLWPNDDKTKGEHIDYGELEIGGNWYKARVFQNNGHRKLQVRQMLNHEIDRAIKKRNEYEAKRQSQAHQNVNRIQEEIRGNPNFGNNAPDKDEIPF